MNESAKCRSGLPRLRTVSTCFSGRGGKSADALGDDEGEASQGNGDVVVPSAEATPLEMIEAELALEVFVHPFGSPALVDDAHGLLAGEATSRRVRQPEDMILGRCGLTTFPFHEQPDVLGLALVDAVALYHVDSLQRKVRRQRGLAPLAPHRLAEGFAAKTDGKVLDRDRFIVDWPTTTIEPPNPIRRHHAHRVREF
ncbi:MAG: hypothetical protein JXQ75_01125 [Phycisphaerae bacterium]|nr:hypothetical protein [Phycisphaerae bacterium]